MYLDRITVKEEARRTIRENQRLVFLTTAVFLLLSGVFSLLTYWLRGYTPPVLSHYYELANAGQLGKAIEYLSSVEPSFGGSATSLLITLVSAAINLGFLIFLLNVLRNDGPAMGNLLDGFNYWLKLILLDLLVGLLVILWSLLFLVPGIIASYRYSMAQYLLVTHPEYSVMDCIRRSKDLTEGHKWELFVLDLSFLGWLLLCAIPIVGFFLALWVQPYISLSRLVYFESFSNDTNTNGPAVLY